MNHARQKTVCDKNNRLFVFVITDVINRCYFDQNNDKFPRDAIRLRYILARLNRCAILGTVSLLKMQKLFSLSIIDKKKKKIDVYQLTIFFFFVLQRFSKI